MGGERLLLTWCLSANGEGRWLKVLGGVEKRWISGMEGGDKVWMRVD